MAQKITAGIFEARISNYGITVTKEGHPQVAILFDYNDHDGTPHEVTWFGTLKEGKGQEFTLKSLLYCGFSGSDPADLADGANTGLLDTMTPVKITIEEQEYNGKRQMKVAWINRIGGAIKSITKSEAKLKMGALNLKGALAAARQETGIKAEQRTNVPKQAVGQSFPEPGSDFDQDLGF